MGSVELGYDRGAFLPLPLARLERLLGLTTGPVHLLGQAVWSIYLSLLSRSIQSPLSARETQDPSLKKMFKNVIQNGLSPESWSSEEEAREGEDTVEEVLEGEDSKEGEVVEWLDEGDPKAIAFREKYVSSSLWPCVVSARSSCWLEMKTMQERV